MIVVVVGREEAKEWRFDYRDCSGIRDAHQLACLLTNLLH